MERVPLANGARKEGVETVVCAAVDALKLLAMASSASPVAVRQWFQVVASHLCQAMQ